MIRKRSFIKFLTFAGSGRDIADPWYTGNFDETMKIYRKVVRDFWIIWRNMEKSITDISEEHKSETIQRYDSKRRRKLLFSVDVKLLYKSENFYYTDSYSRQLRFQQRNLLSAILQWKFFPRKYLIMLSDQNHFVRRCESTQDFVRTFVRFVSQKGN